MTEKNWHESPEKGATGCKKYTKNFLKIFQRDQKKSRKFSGISPEKILMRFSRLTR